MVSNLQLFYIVNFLLLQYKFLNICFIGIADCLNLDLHASFDHTLIIVAFPSYLKSS